jgi:hypothetical protein
MSKTSVETAAAPGRKPCVLPIYGCKGNTCRKHCYYFNGVMQLIARAAKCSLCAEGRGRPHLHSVELLQLPKTGGHVYSGHMGETADLTPAEILHLQSVIENHPGDIFQIFTHQPEFWRRYPDWPSNTWAMTTFTEGLIWRPAALMAGKMVAYAEPILGPLELGNFGFDLLVIGLLNHSQKFQHIDRLRSWYIELFYQAKTLGIPIFCKNLADPRWRRTGITPVQQWPEGF